VAAQNGVHDGPFAQWWGETLLSLEGDDHLRLRRLLGPAFRSRAIEAMRPQFQQLAGRAHRRLRGARSRRARGGVRRAVRRPGAVPAPRAADEEWAQVAHWADDLGKSFGINLRHDLPRIEAALEGLTGYVDEVVADRRAPDRATTSSARWSRPRTTRRSTSAS
jgi:cytochrome P450